MYGIKSCFFVALLIVCFGTTLGAVTTFLGGLTLVSTVASTVPGNGDQNPYGIFQIPNSSGKLVAGHFLISNFNNSQNFQGTGSTIVQISPGGQQSVFAHIDGTTLPGPCPAWA